MGARARSCTMPVSRVQPCTHRKWHVQGALAAISELEGGHQGLVSPAQCLQYDLNTESSASAKSKLHQAFADIKSPVQVRSQSVEGAERLEVV